MSSISAHLSPPLRPFAILTVVVLFHQGKLLLLQRAPTKAFAPKRWTGIGGKIEPGELGDVTAAARRELFEETDLAPDEVSELVLRRTLTFDRPGEGLVCLLYLTGTTVTGRVPSCNEGTLAWVSAAELGQLDLVENSGAVIGLLAADVGRDETPVRCGVAVYGSSGALVRIVFDDADVHFGSGRTS
jgi:8-oxo-dGTP diphosphatase